MPKNDTAAQPELETAAPAPAEAPEQSIAVIVEHNPVVVLLDEEKRELLFAHIESELETFEHDLTTTAGREATRRFAAKITKTKTAADAAGLAFTAEARQKIADINAARSTVKDRLSALADRARQPLTDWEQAEEKRVEECETALREFTAMGVVPLEATAEMVEHAITVAERTEIDAAKFQGMTEAAIKAKNHALELLRNALVRIRQQEAERAELEKLRAESAERAEREAREAQEREAADAERRAAEEAEAERIRAEEIAARRAEEEAAERRASEEAAAKAATEAAQREAEEAAKAEREAAEAKAAAALAEERRLREEAEERAAAAERERQEESDRVAREQKRLEAEAAAEAERRAKAEADQAHRTKCKSEAKAVILTTGVSDDQARAIVQLIVSGEVPRVTLDFAAEPKVKPASTEAASQPALV